MYEYKVKEIVRVVDGDTVDLLIDLGFDLIKKERVRLAGIDTPESRTSDEEEKVFGLEAAEYLKSRLDSVSNIKVKTEKDGKYGRMLGHLYDEKGSVNDDLVEKGYAWRYDGKTRENNLDDLRRVRGLI
jgi:micrococcal nuclease